MLRSLFGSRHTKQEKEKTRKEKNNKKRGIGKLIVKPDAPANKSIQTHNDTSYKTTSLKT